MPALFRTAALCGALLLCQTASAQLFRPADNAPPSPPAVAAKLASRGELKGIRVYEMRMVRRNDVLQALNRLSSAVYVLMLLCLIQEKAGEQR